MDYNITVHNRYSNLSAREIDTMDTGEKSGEKSGENSSEVLTRNEFICSTMDEKMNMMFDELRSIRQEQMSCSKGNVLIQRSLEQVNNKLDQTILVTNDQTTLMKTLAYKSIDIEARSRRNNLVFRGFAENAGENCTDILLTCFENRLGIARDEVSINRAHRVGMYSGDRRRGSRPIIANFQYYSDVELIMSRTNRLKNSSVSIDHDFPKEIQEARSRLWPKYKHYRELYKNTNSKVRIVYPAKLIIDGRVIHDEMPEWDFCMRNTRLPNINYITQSKKHYRVVQNDQFMPTVDHTIQNTQFPQGNLPEVSLKSSQQAMNPIQLEQHTQYSQFPIVTQASTNVMTTTPQTLQGYATSMTYANSNLELLSHHSASTMTPTHQMHDSLHQLLAPSMPPVNDMQGQMHQQHASTTTPACQVLGGMPQHMALVTTHANNIQGMSPQQPASVTAHVNVIQGPLPQQHASTASPALQVQEPLLQQQASVTTPATQMQVQLPKAMQHNMTETTYSARAQGENKPTYGKSVDSTVITHPNIDTDTNIKINNLLPSSEGPTMNDKTVSKEKHGVTHISRATNRSAKRSQSANPYNRSLSRPRNSQSAKNNCVSEKQQSCDPPPQNSTCS